MLDWWRRGLRFDSWLSALPSNDSGQVVHACASVTKQYNLVPVKGQWCSLAGKVTVVLVESNRSLPSGLWLRRLQPDCLEAGISSGAYACVECIIPLHLPLQLCCNDIIDCTFINVAENITLPHSGVSRKRGTACRAQKRSCWRMWWSAMLRSCLSSHQTYCISSRPSWTPTNSCLPAYRWVFRYARYNVIAVLFSF